jgi:hypothetical protein
MNGYGEISDIIINSRGELRFRCVNHASGFHIIGLFTWADYLGPDDSWRNLNEVEFLTINDDEFV